MFESRAGFFSASASQVGFVIDFEFAAIQATSCFSMPLADGILQSPIPLIGFESSERRASFLPENFQRDPVPSNTRASVWLCEAERELFCDFGFGDIKWRVEDFFVAQFEPARARVRVELLCKDDLSRSEICLGALPALLLNQLGRYVLHASAIAHQDQVCVFLGASGAGKSTTAHLLDGMNSWVRVSDDITPVLIHADSVQVCPAFLQLKQSATMRPQTLAKQKYYLAAIMHLQRAAVGSDVQIEKLQSTVAFKALLQNAAATRGLSAHGLQLHWRAMQNLMQLVPIYQLQIPQSERPFNALAESIAKRISLLVRSQ